MVLNRCVSGNVMISEIDNIEISRLKNQYLFEYSRAVFRTIANSVDLRSDCISYTI